MKNEMYSSVNFLGELTQRVIKDFQNRKHLFCKLFTMGGGMCAVPFSIFQITADEQCLGEIPPVGDHFESAFEDQDKSELTETSHLMEDVI